MLEERGGWISGEAPKHDEEMTDAVIEVLAEASNQGTRDELNPFKEQYGEILPPNMERNFCGFLVRNDAITFKVNLQKLSERIAMLKDQLLIAKFIGPKPTIQDLKLWIQDLNKELRGSSLALCRNVGKGFFFLSGDDKDALHNALMLSPFKSKWGTCMIQSWVPGFNPENPSNLAFPTWVALRRLPYEHHDQSLAIAETLGEVIGIDTTNEIALDPRFCINLKVNKGWVTCIELESKDGISPPHKVLVDYNKLPIRCRACHSWKHKVSECDTIQKKPKRGLRRPPQAFHLRHQEKGKEPELDLDGFQQVRHRRGTWRNIFEEGNNELRRPTWEQKVASGGLETRPHSWRPSTNEDPERAGGNLAGRGKPGELGSNSDGRMRANGSNFGAENIMPNNPAGSGLGSVAEGLGHTENEASEDRRIQQQVEEDSNMLEGDCVHNSAPEQQEQPVAGNMQWSPTKIVGQKRGLEELFRADREGEDNEELEEGECSEEEEELNPATEGNADCLNNPNKEGNQQEEGHMDAAEASCSPENPAGEANDNLHVDGFAELGNEVNTDQIETWQVAAGEMGQAAGRKPIEIGQVTTRETRQAAGREPTHSALGGHAEGSPRGLSGPVNWEAVGNLSEAGPLFINDRPVEKKVKDTVT